jgi:hypothetical protein
MPISIRLRRVAAVAGLAIGVGIAFVAAESALAAGYVVQEINSPGPAARLSGGGAVTGYFVAKCTTLSSQPKRTICYYAPWVFDGHRVTKLTSKFASNANAKAVAVNDALEVVGADVNGAWYYSKGNVAYPDASGSNVRGTRLLAVNNRGVALGMSYVSGIYQPVSYRFNGTPTPVLVPGEAAADINDAGMIAGWYKDADNTEYAFVADATGTLFSVPKLDPASNCRPVRISQLNATTGDAWVAGHCAGRPFAYRANVAAGSGTLWELGNVPGFTNLSVQAINSSGVAVGTGVRPGTAAPDGYTAVLWTNDSATGYTIPRDLNELQPFAPGAAWNAHAADINETGTILTGYNDTAGNFFTFLLHPAP